MAGVFADSHDWYSSAQLTRVYDAIIQSGTITPGAFGPAGGTGIRFTGAFGDRVARTGMTWVSGNTFIWEQDIKLTAYPASSQNSIVAVLQGGAADANIQSTLSINSAGHLIATRGDGSTTVNLSTSSYTIPLNTALRLSLQIVIDNSAGEFLLDVYSLPGGTKTTVFSLTGLDTQLTGSGTWDGFFYSATSDGTTDFGNTVAMDATGTRWNSRMGVRTTKSLFPVSDGAHTDSTPLTGTSRAAMVDDATADDDTTYNALSTSAQTDTFTVQTVDPTSNTVLWGLILWQAKTTGAPGTVGLKPVARQGGSDTVGATALLLGSVYTGVITPTLYQADLSSTTWTTAAWNAMEWGYQLNQTLGARVTQFVAIAVINPIGTPADDVCTGGGAIDVVADPTAGETFTGRELDIRTWLELAFDDQDRQYAQDSANHVATYYGGRKAGLLVSYGTIWRRLSYPSGSYQVAEAGIDVDDTSRVFAALEEVTATKPWWNREGRIRLASPTTIAAAGTPHTLFRGIWRGQPTRNLSARTIQLTDLLGSDFSPFQLERSIARRLINATDHNDAPVESLGRAVPIIYGVWQSTLRTSQVAMQVGGVPGGFYQFGVGLSGPEVGYVPTVNGNGIELNGLIDADHRSWDVLPGTTPTNVTIVSAGAGTLPATRNNSWTAMVTAIHGTTESDPAEVAGIALGSDGAVTVSWTAASGGATGGYNIYLCDNPFGVPTKFSTYGAPFFVGSSNVYVSHVGSGTTTITISAPGTPYAFDVVYLYQVSAVFTDGTESAPGGVTLGLSHPYARPIRLRWTAFTDTDLDHYVVRRAPFKGIGQDPQFDREFSVAAGVTSSIDGIDQVIFTDTFDDGLALSVGAVTPPKGGPIPIIDAGSETIGGVVWGRFVVCAHAIAHIEDAFQGGVPIDSSLYGVSILVPDGTGWPFGTTYQDRNGRRYTEIYLKDELLASHRDGSKPVTLSGCFIEDVGDDSGNTITRAPRVIAHLIEQWGIQDYQSGVWAAASTSADGVPWLNTISFNALEAIEIARLAAYRSAVGEVSDASDAEGYELSLYIDDSITLRTALESRFTVDTDTYFGQNAFGQLVAMHPPDAYDSGTATRLTDVYEIVADTPTQQKIEELETTRVFDFALHPASGAFLQVNTGIQNDTAITNNRSKDVRGDRRSLYGVQKTAQARDIARRSLTRTGRPPRYVTVTCSLHALSVKLGDVVLVTDMDGTGATGWTARPLWVIGVGVTIPELDQEPTVTLECIDAVWLTDSAPTLTVINSPAPQKNAGSTVSTTSSAGNWSAEISESVIGQVAGPSSATDNAIVRYDGTTGKIIQDSSPTIPDDGRISDVTDPTDPQDVATKNYVDGVSGSSGITQLTGDATAGPGSGSQVLTIANDAVTYAKMQNVSAASRLLGRGAGSGSGDVQELSLGSGLSLTGTTLSGTGGSGSGNITDTGAVGSEPGSPNAGDVYLPNNGFSLERYSGSLWVPWGPLFPLTDPSISGPTTWVNQDTSSVSTTNGGIFFQGYATNAIHARVKTAPATPYTATMACLPLQNFHGNSYVGMCFRESGTNKVMEYVLSNDPFLKLFTWSSSTVFVGTTTTETLINAGGLFFLRIADDGTNLKFSTSTDGQHFQELYSQTRGTFFTTAPDQIGFCGRSTSAFPATMTILSWKEA